VSLRDADALSRDLEKLNVALLSLSDPSGHVAGAIVQTGEGYAVGVHAAGNPCVWDAPCRAVLSEREAVSRREIAVKARREVRMHAGARRALSDAQRRLYTPESVRN
jgi:hypothetical protein